MTNKEKLTQVKYDTMLEEYLTAQGPCPAGDQFGRMAWRIHNAKIFAKKIEDQYDLTEITTFPKVGIKLKDNAGIEFEG